MSSMLPIMTSELATRIEACIVASSAEKMNALRALPGNPYNVEVRAFGGVTAFLASRIDDSDLFNIVGNMGGADLTHLDAILAWYEAHGVQCGIDIIPSQAEPELFRQLAARGFYQSGFYTVCYGLPSHGELAPAPDVTVREVFPDEQDVFAGIYLESFAVSRERASYLRDSIRLHVGRPATSCFFALVEGEIAAIATLYIHKHFGYLALSATLPAYRGRGCQKALIHARMQKAEEMNCTLIVGQAEFGSISHQNMEKSGLHIAYLKALWTKYRK